MKRFFSGSKHDKNNSNESRSSSLSSNTARSIFGSSSNNNNNNNNTTTEETNRGAFSPSTRARATSFGRRLLSSDSSPNIPQFATDSQQQLSSDNIPELSPILTPIVTLLSAQAHRRYHKGPILVLHDLKNDGTPADRVWKEYFAILLGTQVALWDAQELNLSRSNSNSQNNSNNKNQISLKPKYINITDATLRPLDSDDYSNDQSNFNFDANLHNNNNNNVLVLSTTLQNRYLFKFNDFNSYNEWTAAIRLSLYEHVSLQEAYTGAFLSSRGSKLGDIKNILASNNKFTYSEWVSVRFGPGMPWQRCFAVVTQYNKKISEKDNKNSKKKKKNINKKKSTNLFKKMSKKDNDNDDNEDDNDDIPIEEAFENDNITSDQNYNGTIAFYENDKKINKKYAIAIVTDATALYAVYPSSPLLIDNSTILKLDGYVSMGQDNKIQNSSIFIMAEKHLGVPSYDTIIRFMVPAMNAFDLYGRPKQLIANRNDPNSLMFALPTLPCVHYLPVEDILDMINNNETSPWNNEDWNYHIDQLLQLKIKDNNYTGYGFKPKSQTIYSSPKVEPDELFKTNELTSSSSFLNQVAENDNKFSSPTRSTNNRLSSPTRYNNTNQNNSNLLYQTDMSVAENTNANENERPISSQESIQRRSILGTQDSQHSGEQFTNRSPYKQQNEYTSLSPDKVNMGYSSNHQSPVKSLPYPPVLVNHDEEISTPPSFTKLHSVSPTKSEGYESPYEEYVGIDSQNKPFEISGINEPTDPNDEDFFTSAHSFTKESDNEIEPSSDDDVPIKRTDEFDMDTNYSDLINKIDDININNSSASFEKRSPVDQKIVPEGDIDPDIASGLYLNSHLPFDKKTNSNVSNNQSQGKQTVEADVFDPDYVEQYQINETENIFTGQESPLGNNHANKSPVRSPQKDSSLPILASNMNLHQHPGMNYNKTLPSMQNNPQFQPQPQHTGPQRFTNQSMPTNNNNMAPNIFNRPAVGPNHPSRIQGGYPQGRQQQQQQYQRQTYQTLPPPQQQQYQRQMNQSLPQPQQVQQQYMNRGPYNKPAMGGRIPPPNGASTNKGFSQFMPNTPTKNPYANN